MRTVRLSLVVMVALTTVSIASDTLADAFANGKVSGQIRTFYIDRTYDGVLQNNRNSLATGGSMGFVTAPLEGFSLGAKFYTTNGINIHGSNRTSVDYDPSLYGRNFDSYSMIGEGYINYKNGNTNVKIGRQKLNTPLAGADDARMLPNLFEAVVVSNVDIEDTSLVLAHITKESVGTFGNVYGTPSQLSLQSGYGLGYQLGGSGRFADMGDIALGSGSDTDGVSVASAIYKGIPNLKLQVWDYFAHDILNAVYLQADYGWNCLMNFNIKMKASAQYINQSDIGDKLAGEVDSNFMGAKLGAGYQGLSGYIAYSSTDSSSIAQANGGILTPWGGMPAFTQGMVTRHMFFADTDATKVALSYNFKEMGADVKASLYHASFDIGANNSYKNGQDWTAKESGFDIQYNPAGIKNLNLRLRANYPMDFAPDLDWSEYRIIANYNF